MVSRNDQIQAEDIRLRRFQREADDIARLVLQTDLPWIDIAIRIEQLRCRAHRLFPGRETLFERIYVRRFERLWDQWRPGERRE